MKFELKENSFTNIAYEALTNSLADSPTFREICGVESENKARERIYIDTLPAPEFGSHFAKRELERYLPCAVLRTSGCGSSFGREDAGVGQFHSTGRLAMTLYLMIPDGFVVKERMTSQCVQILESIAGEIIMDMEAKTRIPNKRYLIFDSVRVPYIDLNTAEEQNAVMNIANIHIEFNY